MSDYRVRRRCDEELFGLRQRVVGQLRTSEQPMIAQQQGVVMVEKGRAVHESEADTVGALRHAVEEFSQHDQEGTGVISASDGGVPYNALTYEIEVDGTALTLSSEEAVAALRRVAERLGEVVTSSRQADLVPLVNARQLSDLVKPQGAWSCSTEATTL